MKRTALIAVLVVAALFGVVAYSNAAVSSSTVTINATVQPRAQISVPASVDLGDIDPLTPASDTVHIDAKTNYAAQLSAAVDPGAGATAFATLNSNIETTPRAVKGGNISEDDTVQGTVGWDTDSGTILEGGIIYTLNP